MLFLIQGIPAREKEVPADEARTKVEMEDMVTYLKHKQGKYMCI